MKRILTLGLIVVLSCTLLVGCGGGGGGQTSNNNNTASDPANNSGADSNAASNADSSSDTKAVLSPPAWLIGEWTPADPVFNNQDILVTNNNVVFNSGALDIEWQVKNVGLAVEERLDGEVYTISYEISGMVFTYSFKNQGGNALVLEFGIGDVLTEMDFVKK